MNSARYGHTATSLPNGKVLYSGGGDESVIVASGELYDAGLATPPQISSQPSSQKVVPTSNATFSVAASGTPPLAYRWRF